MQTQFSGLHQTSPQKSPKAPLSRFSASKKGKKKVFPHQLLPQSVLNHKQMSNKSDTERDDALLQKNLVTCIDTPRFEFQEPKTVNLLDEAVQVIVTSKIKSYGFMAKEFYEIKSVIGKPQRETLFEFSTNLSSSLQGSTIQIQTSGEVKKHPFLILQFPTTCCLCYRKRLLRVFKREEPNRGEKPQFDTPQEEFIGCVRNVGWRNPTWKIQTQKKEIKYTLQRNSKLSNES